MISSSLGNSKDWWSPSIPTKNLPHEEQFCHSQILDSTCMFTDEKSCWFLAWVNFVPTLRYYIQVLEIKILVEVLSCGLINGSRVLLNAELSRSGAPPKQTQITLSRPSFSLMKRKSSKHSLLRLLRCGALRFLCCLSEVSCLAFLVAIWKSKLTFSETASVGDMYSQEFSRPIKFFLTNPIMNSCRINCRAWLWWQK